MTGLIQVKKGHHGFPDEIRSRARSKTGEHGAALAFPVSVRRNNRFRRLRPLGSYLLVGDCRRHDARIGLRGAPGALNWAGSTTGPAHGFSD